MRLSSNASDAVQGLTAPYEPLTFFLDLDPPLGDFRTDVLEGLAKPQKALSPKYLYDEAGSQIFDEITRVPEYYPTRTERGIVEQYKDEIATAIGPGRCVFEYGSGSSEKIDALLSLMDQPAGYVAMDISRDHLLTSAKDFAERTTLPVGAVCADFTAALDMLNKVVAEDTKWLGFFPGSTLGNLSTDDAVQFLGNASEALGPDARFFLGLDLEKDRETLQLAYDDPKGITADFNLNLLTRIKRELGADLDEGDFEHHLIIPEAPQRVEMHLRALRPTTIALEGQTFHFGTGETLHTENSNKFTLPRLDDLLSNTPWKRVETWVDERQWFSTCLLSNN